MAKIPFDIKYRPQIESGEYKVETRDGRPARVICWDFNDGDYVIVAVVPNICGTRGFITYTDEGIYMIGEENVFDLFLITTEPELKENEDDERTRKEIIEHFLPHKNELLVKKWIAYLEKQKEPNPMESISHLTVQGNGVYKICPYCKSRMIRDDSKVYTSIPPKYGYNCPKCGAMEFDTVIYDNPEMEEQRPAEWSEEDEEVYYLLDCILNDFTNAFKESAAGYKRACADADKVYSWVHNRLEPISPKPHEELDEEEVDFFIEDVKFPFKAKEKSTGKIVTITSGTENDDGASYYFFWSGKNRYLPEDLLKIK